MAVHDDMGETSLDPDRTHQRVTYALVHDNTAAEAQVLIAKDEDSIGQALALEVVALTPPERLGSHLAAIQNALVGQRWAEALVEWMSATGQVVDVYPDEPIRESLIDAETIEFKLLLKPIFGNLNA